MHAFGLVRSINALNPESGIKRNGRAPACCFLSSCIYSLDPPPRTRCPIRRMVFLSPSIFSVIVPPCARIKSSASPCKKGAHLHILRNSLPFYHPSIQCIESPSSIFNRSAGDWRALVFVHAPLTIFFLVAPFSIPLPFSPLTLHCSNFFSSLRFSIAFNPFSPV